MNAVSSDVGSPSRIWPPLWPSPSSSSAAAAAASTQNRLIDAVGKLQTAS